MKVLQRAQMPDGTKIVREEWSENYSFEAYGSMIAAFPRNRHGETFRAHKDFESTEEAEKAFNALKNGDKTLADFNFTTMESARDIPYQNKL